MAISNRILAAIPADEYERLHSKMSEAELPFGMNIYEPGEQMEYVYFVNTGIISLMIAIEDKATVDVGMVGPEGMVSIAGFLGGRISPGRSVVLAEGTAMRIALADFQSICSEGGVLLPVMMRYVRSMMEQLLRSAACYRHHMVKPRLARALLMINDRTATEKLMLTQEFMSTMLGVRRETVNRAAYRLRTNGRIEYDRGSLTIIDRAGLESAACDCYRIIRDEETNAAA